MNSGGFQFSGSLICFPESVLESKDSSFKNVGWILPLESTHQPVGLNLTRDFAFRGWRGVKISERKVGVVRYKVSLCTMPSFVLPLIREKPHKERTLAIGIDGDWRDGRRLDSLMVFTIMVQKNGIVKILETDFKIGSVDAFMYQEKRRENLKL